MSIFLWNLFVDIEWNIVKELFGKLEILEKKEPFKANQFLANILSFYICHETVWRPVFSATSLTLLQNEKNICERNRITEEDIPRINVTCNLRNLFECPVFKTMGMSQRYTEPDFVWKTCYSTIRTKLLDFCLVNMLQRYTDANFCLARKYAPQLCFNSIIQQY